MQRRFAINLVSRCFIILSAIMISGSFHKLTNHQIKNSETCFCIFFFIFDMNILLKINRHLFTYLADLSQNILSKSTWNLGTQSTRISMSKGMEANIDENHINLRSTVTKITLSHDFLGKCFSNWHVGTQIQDSHADCDR